MGKCCASAIKSNKPLKHPEPTPQVQGQTKSLEKVQKNSENMKIQIYKPDEKTFKFVDIQNIKQLEDIFFDAVISINESVIYKCLDYNFRHERMTLVEQQGTGFTDQKNIVLIKDVSQVRLVNRVQNKEEYKLDLKKQFKNTQLWNVCLIMIATNQIQPLQKYVLTRGFTFTHLRSLFQKPVPLDTQAQTIFGQRKRIKIESFALKLAILNKNLPILNFLMNGSITSKDEDQSEKEGSFPNNEEEYPLGEQIGDQLAQLWNVGHILYCLKQIVKIDWKDGLEELLEMRRVKQLFSSVNDPSNFLNLLQELILIFFEPLTKNSGNGKQIKSSESLCNLLLTSFDDEPYLLLRILIGAYSGLLSTNEIEVCLLKLTRNSVCFFTTELKFILEQFDPKNLISDVKKEILATCVTPGDETQKNDYQIHQIIMHLYFTLRQLVIESINMKSDKFLPQDQVDEVINTLEQIDPFTYKIYDQNIFTHDTHGQDEDTEIKRGLISLILSTGDQSFIDYIFSSSADCNIRSQLINFDSPQEELQQTKNFKQLNNDFMQRESIRNEQLKTQMNNLDQKNSQQLINRFEMYETQDLIKIDIRFFQPLIQMKSEQRFRFVFSFVIEQLNLYAIADLIILIAQTTNIKPKQQIQYISDIVLHLKVSSMFQNGLEADKIYFVKLLSSALKDPEYFDTYTLGKADQSKLRSIHLSVSYLEPYIHYFQSDKPIKIDVDYSKATNIYFLSLKDQVIRLQKSADANSYWKTPDRKKIFVINTALKTSQKKGTLNNLTFSSQEMNKQLQEVNNKPVESQNKKPIQDSNKKVPEPIKQKPQETYQVEKLDLNMNSLITLQKPSGNETQREKASKKFNLNENINYTERKPQNYTSEQDEQTLETLRDSQIQICLNEMQGVIIESDASIAFSELVRSILANECDFAEAAEIIQDFSFNPFHQSLIYYPEYDQERLTLGNQNNQLYSLFLHATIANQTQLVDLFLEAKEFQQQIDCVALLRPPNNNQELHILQKGTGAQKQFDDNDESYMLPRQIILQKIIQNKNKKLFGLVLSKFCFSFCVEDIFEICNFLINDQNQLWEEGLNIFLSSLTIKSAFIHFRPSDKDRFLNLLIKSFLDENQNNLKKVYSLILKSDVYSPLLILKYPEQLCKLNLKSGLNPNLITQQDLVNFCLISQDNPKIFRQQISSLNQPDQVLQNLGKQLRNIDFANLEQLIFDPLEIIQQIQQNKISQAIKKLQQISQAENEKSLLFRYQGYQIKSFKEQAVIVRFLPIDETIQSLLYHSVDINKVKDKAKGIVQEKLDSDRSENVIQKQIKELGSLTRETCLKTYFWNPLIYAIFYGRIEVVKSIFAQAEQQLIASKTQQINSINSLLFLLSEPFKIAKENDDEFSQGSEQVDEFMEERSFLLPLILCLMTEQPEMLSLLWNHPQLWNNCNFLILLANFVFETQQTSLIRVFLTSQKTCQLFQYMSKVEKTKFIQFTISELQKQIVSASQTGSQYEEEPDEENVRIGFLIDTKQINKLEEAEQKEISRSELEFILNNEFLSQPPYSLVNIPNNLLPIHINSEIQDILHIIEQYEESPENLQILDLAINNLTLNSNLTWQIVWQNEIWARRFYMLIQQLIQEHPSQYKPFLQKVHKQLLMPHVKIEE